MFSLFSTGMTFSLTKLPSTHWATHSLAPTIAYYAFCLRFLFIPSVILDIYTNVIPCSTPRPALYWNNKIVILLQLGCLKFPFRFEMLILFLTLALINASIFAFSLVFFSFVRTLSSKSITMILLKCWCVQTIQQAEETLIHCTTPYQLGLRLEVILKWKSDFSINKRYKFSFHFFLNKVFT